MAMRFPFPKLSQTRPALSIQAACLIGLTLSLAVHNTSYAQTAPAPSQQPVAPAVEVAPPLVAPAPSAAQAAPPTVTLAPSNVTAPPAANAAPLPAAPASVPELTRQLLDLELRTRQLEQDRDRIRVKGPRIGKIVTWTAASFMLLSAVGAWGQAEMVKKAIEKDWTGDAYDTNGNDKVTKADENRQRAIARGWVIGSLIPIGLGTWLTILHRKRLKQIKTHNFQLEDLAVKRRSLLNRLGAEVGVAPTLASVQLKLAF